MWRQALRAIRMTGLAGLAVMGLVARAEAGLEVCNATEARQSVAIGYEAPGGDWTSEGWWLIDPGSCKTVMGRELGRQSFYYRATVAGGGFDGRFAFCTTGEPFTIQGDEDCAARGYERTRFRKVVTDGVAHFTLTLVADRARTPEETSADPGEFAPSEVSVPFVQGQLGEPFTQRGIFAGCHLIDGLDYCGFEVDGWRYFAIYGGGTADGLLDALQDWPVPLAVELSGDMVHFGDITVEIALGRVSEVPDGDPFAEARSALQGAWQSADDPAVTMRVLGADVYEYYDGQLTGHHWLHLRPHCEGMQGLGIGFHRTELETQDGWCLILGDVGPGFVEFTNPGRGNGLLYRRLQ